jgi:hypothetical protein
MVVLGMISHCDPESSTERQERIQARGGEYRAGLMSEELFRAYLFSMRVRGEDIEHELGAYAPPQRAQSFEERRLEASHQWLKEYIGATVRR